MKWNGHIGTKLERSLTQLMMNLRGNETLDYSRKERFIQEEVIMQYRYGRTSYLIEDAANGRLSFNLDNGIERRQLRVANRSERRRGRAKNRKK